MFENVRPLQRAEEHKRSLALADRWSSSRGRVARLETSSLKIDFIAVAGSYVSRILPCAKRKGRAT
jgi:hypothetical protein